MSDVSDVIPAVALPRVPVAGGGSFPVHRIYCVGRNFADHAREMGAAVPAADDPAPWVSLAKVVGGTAVLLAAGVTLFAHGRRRVAAAA